MDAAYTLGAVIEEESVRPSLSAGQEKGVQHTLSMSKSGARIGVSDSQPTGSSVCANEGDAAVQNVASAERGPGDNAPLEIAELARIAILKAEWAGKASLAGSRDSNPDASHVRGDGGLVDSTLGQLEEEEDVQSLLGSLFVRAEVAEKETEGFGRVVQRLQEQIAHYKLKARRYKCAIHEGERKLSSLQSECGALVDYNRELFASAEKLSSQLAVQARVQRRVFGHQVLRHRVMTAAGRVWRAWHGLNIMTRRHRVLFLLATRRKVVQYQSLVVRTWKGNLHNHRFIRMWLRAWRRTSSRAAALRHRRGMLVQLSALRKRAKRWKREVLQRWIQTVLTSRKANVYNRRIQARIATMQTITLRTVLLAWSRNACEARRYREILGCSLRHTLSRIVMSEWQRQLVGPRLRLECLKSKFWSWGRGAKEQLVKRQLLQWFLLRRNEARARHALLGWNTRVQTVANLCDCQSRRKAKLLWGAFVDCRRHATVMLQMRVLRRQYKRGFVRSAMRLWQIMAQARQRQRRGVIMCRQRNMLLNARALLVRSLTQWCTRAYQHREQAQTRLEGQRAARALRLDLMQSAWTVLAVHKRDAVRRRNQRQFAVSIFERQMMRSQQECLRMLMSQWRLIAFRIGRARAHGRQRQNLRSLKRTRVLLVGWAQRAKVKRDAERQQAQRIKTRRLMLHFCLLRQSIQRIKSQRRIEMALERDHRAALLSRAFLALKYAATVSKSRHAKKRAVSSRVCTHEQVLAKLSRQEQVGAPPCDGEECLSKTPLKFRLQSSGLLHPVARQAWSLSSPEHDPACSLRAWGDLRSPQIPSRFSNFVSLTLQ